MKIEVEQIKAIDCKGKFVIIKVDPNKVSREVMNMLHEAFIDAGASQALINDTDMDFEITTETEQKKRVLEDTSSYE